MAQARFNVEFGALSSPRRAAYDWRLGALLLSAADNANAHQASPLRSARG
jgi:hypothetical protein